MLPTRDRSDGARITLRTIGVLDPAPETNREPSCRAGEAVRWLADADIREGQPEVAEPARRPDRRCRSGVDLAPDLAAVRRVAEELAPAHGLTAGEIMADGEDMAAWVGRGEPT